MGIQLETMSSSKEKFHALANYVGQVTETRSVHWAVHRVIDQVYEAELSAETPDIELLGEVTTFLQDQYTEGSLSGAHLQKMAALDIPLDDVDEAIIGHINERSAETPNDRHMAELELFLREQRDQGNVTDDHLAKMIKGKVPFGLPNRIPFMKRLAVEVISDDGRQAIIRMEEGGKPTTLYYPRKTLSLSDAKARRLANRAARDAACQARSDPSSKSKKSA